MKYLKLSIFFFSAICSSQSGLSFSINQQIYLHGESSLIGNNIVSTDAKKPFNENSSINDVLKLEYIDVDDDPETFSSSKANLYIEAQPSNIKYAALYWSAIYKYDKGTRKNLKEKNEIVYRGNDERSSNINSILFKQPNGNYQKINGKIVFDSYSTKLFEDNKPYLCFADVTSLIKNSKTLNGTYTIGNVRATEGYISGGASGGWLLYVIYESPEAKPKYFTTYNGFIEVQKNEPVVINFSGFKTNETGEVKTSLCMGALEGDQKYKTDSCFILDNKNAYIPLSNKLRPVNNFFNGTITLHDELYRDRVQNSSNTLGFDILKLKIHNINNSTISNNSTQATLKLTTIADRFYLFFVAFETEISSIFFESKKNDDSIIVLNTSIEKTEQNKVSGEIVETLSDNKNLLEQKQPIDKIKLEAIEGIQITEVKGGTENSKIIEQNLLQKLREIVTNREQELKKLKEENDLRELGTTNNTAAPVFKSITAENEALESLLKDIDNVINNQNNKISQLKNLYDERLKNVPSKNDSLNNFYLNKIEVLKTIQKETQESREGLLVKLEKIKVATEVERRRRIKKATYENEADRYLKDRSVLNVIKQNTQPSSVLLNEEDFDFGEELGSNIQIIKGVSNAESGYYLVIAVHKDVAKRDEFLKKVVSAGQKDINFFYDMNSGKYFIYYKKYSDIDSARGALNSIGTEAYNSKMSMVKIEN